MSKKISAKNLVLPHTQAKLSLYKDYLNEYLPVLLNSKYIDKINIYDIFCGAGVYEDGKEGSPLIAASCIKQNIANFELNRRLTKPIVLTVNDKDLNKVEAVKNLLGNLISENFISETHNLEADKMFNLVKNQTDNFSAKNRNLVFVDPYGYSDITKKNLYGLLSKRKTEVILFLPVSNIYRFSEVAQNDMDSKCFDNLRRFIHEFFKADSKVVCSQVENIYDYINEIRIALSFDDEFYSSSFYIKRDKVNHYALFFIGHHIYGLEKFLQAKWKNDSLGQGFNVKYSEPSLFGPNLEEVDKHNSKSKLETIIKEHLIKNSFTTNTDLYEFILKNQFLPKDSISILEHWMAIGLLKVYNTKNEEIKSPRSYYMTYTNFKNKDNILKLRYTSKNGTIKH